MISIFILYGIRYTILLGDSSSDVCSSDLGVGVGLGGDRALADEPERPRRQRPGLPEGPVRLCQRGVSEARLRRGLQSGRPGGISVERRVGIEWQTCSY